MKFNMKFLKKKYWVITIFILVIFLLLLMYYYHSNDYMEGATAAASTTETPGQKLIHDTLNKYLNVCGPTNGNSYLCVSKLSEDLLGSNNKDPKKSLLMQKDASQTTLNGKIMQYNPKSSNYNKDVVNNKKTACGVLTGVRTYVGGSNSDSINKYEINYKAGC